MSVKLEWKLGDIKPSEYMKTSIAIASDYRWGEGWTKQQADRFETEVFSKLEQQGFVISYPKDREGSIRSCPSLKTSKEHDKTDLYLHPMEFSGYVTKADCDRIVAVLQSCDCIHGVKIAQQDYCYDISDNMYEEMLYENIHNIVDGFPKFFNQQGFKNMGAYAMQEYAFECVHECRLPRIGDKAGFSSNDIDVKTITNMLKVAKELGHFDKDKEKAKPKQKEGAER